LEIYLTVVFVWKRSPSECWRKIVGNSFLNTEKKKNTGQPIIQQQSEHSSSGSLFQSMDPSSRHLHGSSIVFYLALSYQIRKWDRTHNSTISLIKKITFIAWYSSQLIPIIVDLITTVEDTESAGLLTNPIIIISPLISNKRYFLIISRTRCVGRTKIVEEELITPLLISLLESNLLWLYYEPLLF